MALMKDLRHLVRLAFSATLMAVLLLTLLPTPPAFERLANDKIEHLLAFFGLALLGGFGWPQARGSIIVGLLIIGGLIEILQGTQLIHRDMDFSDWIADAAGVLLGMVCVTAILRLRLRPAR